jgi:hypothetical protein
MEGLEVAGHALGPVHTLPLSRASFIMSRVFSVQRGSSSVVERDLAKVDVAGSTPVSRSSFFFVLPSPSRWTFLP